ncbi:MAG: signal peptidase II [Maribacter sp.]|nr:signal peptidase II [Maribacter sp.]MBT8301978.1 signal peptidase II [Maribacter sp.]
MILLIRTFQKTTLNRWMLVAIVFVVGDDLGNLLDHFSNGSVSDFFQIELGMFNTGIFKWPTCRLRQGFCLY